MSLYRWQGLGLHYCFACEERGAGSGAFSVTKLLRLDRAATDAEHVRDRQYRHKQSGPGSMTSAKEDAIAALIVAGLCTTEIEMQCRTGRLTVRRVAMERGLTLVNKHGKSKALRIKRSQPEPVATPHTHRRTSSGASTAGDSW